ncbi:MAG: methylmalonyl-CoA epimerase [candidate division KSB1 bacterium]|nr:methylmalonyl-CoA epimerase [candidate division KSB1 bacterium]MDZ7276337.1 methylmalonyl-CoA epimerase [candidate division KSB1 bacterium]MDZ7287710.1 methylmalonyl-CoA epimerase [candidate division KSB1 bacterium]MDZ7299950.1 methylmalonyl-CoA epimerase [candidate division KSB1 bacterium]MDZ7305721.1 methylmalonyl-CoA epimerase [candidate division KSB1 bacterium]
MLEKIDHIGIAVRDLDEAIKRYTLLMAAPPAHLEEVPTQQVKVAMFNVGASRVELLAATSPESAIAKFLDKRGEGLHHLCFRVDDLAAALARVQAGGMEVVAGAGTAGAGGSRVAFLHPRSAAGVLIELVEHKQAGS